MRQWGSYLSLSQLNSPIYESDKNSGSRYLEGHCCISSIVRMRYLAPCVCAPVHCRHGTQTVAVRLLLLSGIWLSRKKTARRLPLVRPSGPACEYFWTSAPGTNADLHTGVSGTRTLPKAGAWTGITPN